MKKLTLLLSLILTLALAGQGWCDFIRHGNGMGLGMGLGMGSGSIPYSLQDNFLGTIAAGSVNGTNANPGPGGARYVVDSGNRVSISNGLTWYGRASTWNPSMTYALHTRVPGYVLAEQFTFNTTMTDNQPVIGYGSTSSGLLSSGEAFNWEGAVDMAVYDNSVNKPVAYPGGLNTTYSQFIVERAQGAQYFLKTADGPPQLLWVSSSLATNLYPGFASSSDPGYGGGGTISNIRIPKLTFSLTTGILVSDSFVRTDGAIGTTDGKGHWGGNPSGPNAAEGVAGNGLTWTNQVGTVAISGNKAMATALTGGRAIATVPVSTACTMLKAALTHGAGGTSPYCGLVIHYTDANNYQYIINDGTNLKVIERVGGTDTTKISTSMAYSAGAEANITSETLFNIRSGYNLHTGGFSSIFNSVLNAPNVGVIFFDLTSSISNFYCYARGVENQYAGLNSFVSSPQPSYGPPWGSYWQTKFAGGQANGQPYVLAALNELSTNFLIPTGYDNTNTLNNILQNNAGGYVHIPDGNYLISAPLIIYSGTWLDLAPNAQICLAPNSTCNMITNYSSTPQRTVADAAIASGGKTLTSATANFTSTDLGRVVNIIGAGKGVVGFTNPVTATITKINGSTSVIISIAAQTTVTNASCSIYNTDINIKVTGGIWNRGSNNGDGSTLPTHPAMSLVFEHVNGLIVQPRYMLSNSGVWFVSLADCNNYLVSDIVCSTIRDGIHQEGPCSNGNIARVFGYTYDDSISINCAEANNYVYFAGDITNISVDSIYTETLTSVVKVLGGQGTWTNGITLTNIYGKLTYPNSYGVYFPAIWLGDDPNFGNMTNTQSTNIYINGVNTITCHTPPGAVGITGTGVSNLTEQNIYCNP